MLLILWDWECCDAAAGRGSVLVLVGGEEGRPLSGRLAPTPCPDRSSDDDRSPRLSERRTPICRGRPAPPVSGPAGAFRSLGGQTQPKHADPGKVPGPRYTGSRTGERRKAAGLETAQAPRSRDLETGEIQAGFRLVGHRGVKKKARGKTTAQPGVTPVPGTPSASPHSLVSYSIDAGYGNWVCLVVSLLGSSPCPDSRRPVAVSRGRLPVGEGPFVTRGERSVASCQAGRSHSTGTSCNPLIPHGLFAKLALFGIFFAPLVRCPELPVLELPPDCFGCPIILYPPTQGNGPHCRH